MMMNFAAGDSHWPHSPDSESPDAIYREYDAMGRLVIRTLPLEEKRLAASSLPIQYDYSDHSAPSDEYFYPLNKKS